MRNLELSGTKTQKATSAIVLSPRPELPVAPMGRGAVLIKAVLPLIDGAESFVWCATAARPQRVKRKEEQQTENYRERGRTRLQRDASIEQTGAALGPIHGHEGPQLQGHSEETEAITLH